MLFSWYFREADPDMVRTAMSSVNRNDAASNILNRPVPDDGEADFAVHDVATVARESPTPEEPQYEGPPSARGGDTHEITIRGAFMTNSGSSVAMNANTSDEHPRDCTCEQCETEAETGRHVLGFFPVLID